MSTKKSLFAIFKNQKHSSEEVVLTHAHKKAERIIEEAVEKASQVLNQTDLFTSDLKQEVKNMWQSYLEKTAQSIQKDSEILMNKIMDDFEKELVNDLQHAQALLQQKISEEFARVEESLKEYEKSRQTEIDAAIENKIKHIVKTTLSSTLTPQNHEQLVVTALKKAKKDEIFE